MARWVALREVCALLVVCFLFNCDGFVSLLRAEVPRREQRRTPISDPPVSEPASGRPIGAALRARVSFVWDFESRLVQAVSTTQGTIALGYDVDDIRTSKAVNGVATQFLVDKNREFAQVLEACTNNWS